MLKQNFVLEWVKIQVYMNMTALIIQYFMINYYEVLQF